MEWFHVDDLRYSALHHQEMRVVHIQLNTQKELFDFINEHKPDIMDEMGVILKNQLKSKGYVIGSSSKKRVRFTTQSILDLTYINKLGKCVWKG